jgi:hypothetical protein
MREEGGRGGEEGRKGERGEKGGGREKENDECKRRKQLNLSKRGVV